MKILLAILFIISLSEANSNPYDDVQYKLEKGVEIRETYSQILSLKSLQDLSEVSIEMHNKALNVYLNPASEKYKKEYLNIFPKKFSIFLKVFHPKDFKQLYDGHIHIELFNKLAKEYPDLAASTYISLASEACFDADAPNYFREGLNSFKNKNSYLYGQKYNLLSKEKQENIEFFLNASFHNHDSIDGFCK